jgi:secreted trypsin-like serine protease
MKKFLHLCSFLVALSFVGLASAVTNGDLDGENHPYVGLMVGLIDGVPQFRCSGTLISPTVFVTAGHCTDGINEVEIWFDADVESGIPGNGYPFTGDVSGTPFVSPDYIPAAFFVNDLGVVELDEPVVLAGGYAELVTEAGVLDAMKTRRGRQNQDFTAVGYGLQRINPVFVEAERVRMVATPHLIQINTPGFTGDFSLLLSNNHSTGGTCFGDSGGPNFIGDSNVIGGITSFGINGNCAGTGGVYRLDRAHDLAWLATFFD